MALAEAFPPGNGSNALGEGLEATQRPLDEARHLPAYIYTSPELFEMEKQKIFMKDWLAVARAEEVEKPGDYMTFNIMGEPIVVARNHAGELNAFYNVCAHRGVEVAAGEGNLKHFQCPYHAWTYDLSGKLLGAAYMDDVKGFDAGDCRLRPLRLGVWEGWVFVNFDEHAAPLADFVADFAEEFGVFQQGRCRLLPGKIETVLNCNWKLVNENFVDVYHLITLHGDTLTDWPRPENYEYRRMKHGGYATFYEAQAAATDPDKIFDTAPWLTEWMEGKDPVRYMGAGFLTPNFTTFARPYGVSQIIVWPLSPGQCRIVQYRTFPEAYFDLPDFEERKPTYDLMLEILEEDRPMIESLQKVMSSGAFEPGRMSSGEFLVHNYINDYLERMFGD